MGVPHARWMVYIYIYILENPIKMDDLGVPLFKETSIWYHIIIHIAKEPCT